MLLPSQHRLSPSEYQHLVRRRFMPCLATATSTVQLAAAAGKLLAEQLYARENSPAFANSQMDGYALTAAAAQRRNRTFRVGPDVAAGTNVQGFEPNEDIALPIMTGAPLPPGYDCVIPEERALTLTGEPAHFQPEDAQVVLPKADIGQFVRYPGEDLAEGELLADVGARLSPALLGVLASQGITEVLCYTPKVLVLTGGDEVSSNTELQPGQLRDANGPMLEALLAEDGATSKRAQISDDPDELLQILDREIADYAPHLVVSSGGISHGKFEVVKNASVLLAGQKSSTRALHVAESWFGHVTQQPGGPQGVIILEGPAGRIPWMGFPGNPVSTLVTYMTVLRPVLAGEKTVPHVATLMSDEPVRGPEGKTQYRRARLLENGTEQQIILDPLTGSHLLHHAAQANALAVIEPGIEYRAGDVVRWYPLNFQRR